MLEYYYNIVLFYYSQIKYRYYMNISIKTILLFVMIFAMTTKSLCVENKSNEGQIKLYFKSLYEHGFGVLSRQKVIVKKELSPKYAKVKQCRYCIIETNPPIYVEASSLEAKECMEDIFQNEELIEIDAIIYETITTSGIPSGELLNDNEYKNVGVAGTRWNAIHTIVLCKILKFSKKE